MNDDAIWALIGATGGATFAKMMDFILGRRDRKVTLDVQLVDAAGTLVGIGQEQIISLGARLDEMSLSLEGLRTENAKLHDDVQNLRQAHTLAVAEVSRVLRLNDRLRRRVRELEVLVGDHGYAIDVKMDETNDSDESESEVPV